MIHDTKRGRRWFSFFSFSFVCSVFYSALLGLSMRNDVSSLPRWLCITVYTHQPAPCRAACVCLPGDGSGLLFASPIFPASTSSLEREWAVVDQPTQERRHASLLPSSEGQEGGAARDGGDETEGRKSTHRAHVRYIFFLPPDPTRHTVRHRSLAPA